VLSGARTRAIRCAFKDHEFLQVLAQQVGWGSAPCGLTGSPIAGSQPSGESHAVATMNGPLISGGACAGSPGGEWKPPRPLAQDWGDPGEPTLLLVLLLLGSEGLRCSPCADACRECPCFDFEIGSIEGRPPSCSAPGATYFGFLLRLDQRLGCCVAAPAPAQFIAPAASAIQVADLRVRYVGAR